MFEKKIFVLKTEKCFQKLQQTYPWFLDGDAVTFS